MILLFIFTSVLQPLARAVTCPGAFKPTLTIASEFDAEKLGLADAQALPAPKVTYAATFDLASTVSSSAPYDVVLGHILGSLARQKHLLKHEDGPQAFARLQTPLAPVTAIAVDPQRLRLILIEASAAGGPRRFAVFIEHADSRKPELIWRQEFSVAERGDRVRVGARVLAWRLSGRRVGDGRPAMHGIIRKILDDPLLRASSGRAPITRSPVFFSVEDARDLAETVNDPNRSFPLVYVSRRYADGGLYIDANWLAQDLFGFGIVAVESEPGVFAASTNGNTRVFGPGGVPLSKFRASAGSDLGPSRDEVASFVRREATGGGSHESTGFFTVFTLAETP